MRPEARFAVIGDVHANRRILETVLVRLRGSELDGVLLVGDLGSMLPRRAIKEGERRRYLRSVEGVLAAVHDLGHPVAYVPGNHDLPDLAFEGNAHGRQVTIHGIRIVGIGGSPDTFGDPNEFEEEEVRRMALPSSDILLVHTPPANTPLDRVPRRELHVGSQAIRERALAHSGVLVCGHIHESPGACRLGDCLAMNVGGLGRPFGRPQVGFAERWPSGWRVSHEDLISGQVQAWTLEDAPGG